MKTQIQSIVVQSHPLPSQPAARSAALGQQPIARQRKVSVRCSPPETGLAVLTSNEVSTEYRSPRVNTTHSDCGYTDITTECSGGDGNGSSPPQDGDGGRGDDGRGDDPAHPAPAYIEKAMNFLIQGLKGRLEADPYFGHKLLVECGLDAVIIVGVNWMARKERFLAELEFTMCQLAISLSSDFALVYLLAPSAVKRSALAKGVVAGSIHGLVAGLPAHVFQKSIGPKPFTLAARLGTLGLKSVQYGMVGYFMGCLGAACVQALVWTRERTDPNFEPPTTVQSIPGTGMAWSSFMATSSNIRYNLVNGCEDALYRCGPGIGKLGSVALRFANNWAGAAHWVIVANRTNLNVPWNSTNHPGQSSSHSVKE